MNEFLKDEIYNELKKNNLAVFSSKDFIQMSNGKSINKALERLEKNNLIKRVLTGLYYVPKYIEFLDDYELPDVYEVAKALSRKNNWAIAPTGNSALNKLGLSTQVPSKYIFLSSGSYKKYMMENTEIQFKRTNNRELLNYSENTNLIIQAIKTIGRDNVTSIHIDKLKQVFNSKQKKIILQESKVTSIWIYEIIKKICKE